MEARTVLLLWIVVSLFSAGRASAAELSVDYDVDAETRIATIRIKGDIAAGDAARFRSVLRDAKSRNAIVTNVTIHSRGGLVREALEIGGLIRKLGISTSAPVHMGGVYDGVFVSLNSCYVGVKQDSMFNLITGVGDADCECTSACALIWAAGISRFGDRVGFHRPYLRSDELGGMKFSEAEKAQNHIFSRTREYLLSMGMSESIVTKMISVSSKDIYFLNESEINAMSLDPAFDEWLFAKCPERLTPQQKDDMLHLDVKKISGTKVNMTDLRLLDALQTQDERASQCLWSARLEFLKERQGL